MAETLSFQAETNRKAVARYLQKRHRIKVKVLCELRMRGTHGPGDGGVAPDGDSSVSGRKRRLYELVRAVRRKI